MCCSPFRTARMILVRRAEAPSTADQEIAIPVRRRSRANCTIRIIRTACMLAKKGDVILVAGKGHEDYQEIKGVKHHFDDKEVIRDIFGISQK